MKYRSTRGAHRHSSFEDVVLAGLATDKGLYVPESIPTIPLEEIESWRTCSFAELALKIMSHYISQDEISTAELRELLDRSIANFRSPDVTPVVPVGDTWVLELWHGPTFAFKDVALQFLGNLFEFFLTRRRARGQEARLTILGATSGDTGSAAIYGLRGKKFVECFILFPKGRVSEIQERQMTTVLDDNIRCVTVEGTFDDCQDLVKAAFGDKTFREEVQLGAVNSINWARVLAQMTYYFWAYFRVTDKQGTKTPISFSVPTGNFGDVLAGYYARRMGLPVKHLLVATNENNILHRFFSSGKYWREGVQPTLAPSMDICVSSNFERYLFHLAGDSPDALRNWMEQFEASGKLTVDGQLLTQAQTDFMSACVRTDENINHIRNTWDKHQYLYCPHSSIGAAAPRHCGLVAAETVVLATAHPGKFETAVSKAVDPLPPAPPELQALWSLPTKKHDLTNSLQEVQRYIRDCLDPNTPEPSSTPTKSPLASKSQGTAANASPTALNGTSGTDGLEQVYRSAPACSGKRQEAGGGRKTFVFVGLAIAVAVVGYTVLQRNQQRSRV